MDGVELHLAVIRPKSAHTVKLELKPKWLDLMLIDSTASAAVITAAPGGDSLVAAVSSAETTQRPRVVAPHDVDPAERALDHLYHFTGAALGGLKGTRMMVLRALRQHQQPLLLLQQLLLP